MTDKKKKDYTERSGEERRKTNERREGDSPDVKKLLNDCEFEEERADDKRRKIAERRDS